MCATHIQQEQAKHEAVEYGTCRSCGHQFPYRLVHNGFNQSVYAYCRKCGITGFGDKLGGIPTKALPLPYGVIEEKVEALLKPCECGGRFRRKAAPRCPACTRELSARAASSWFEAKYTDTPGEWRWQQSWQGLYAIIVADRSTNLAWAVGLYQEDTIFDPQIYLSGKGRIGRKEWWISTIFLNLVALPLLYEIWLFSELLSNSSKFELPILLVFYVLSILTVAANATVSTKRLHDTGKSGRYFLLCSIPYIGPLALLIFLGFKEGSPGPNQYGSASL